LREEGNYCPVETHKIRPPSEGRGKGKGERSDLGRTPSYSEKNDMTPAGGVQPEIAGGKRTTGGALKRPLSSKRLRGGGKKIQKEKKKKRVQPPSQNEKNLSLRGGFQKIQKNIDICQERECLAKTEGEKGASF